jgi:hypothetical protein
LNIHRAPVESEFCHGCASMKAVALPSTRTTIQQAYLATACADGGKIWADSLLRERLARGVEPPG